MDHVGSADKFRNFSQIWFVKNNTMKSKSLAYDFVGHHPLEGGLVGEKVWTSSWIWGLAPNFLPSASFTEIWDLRFFFYENSIRIIEVYQPINPPQELLERDRSWRRLFHSFDSFGRSFQRPMKTIETAQCNPLGATIPLPHREETRLLSRLRLRSRNWILFALQLPAVAETSVVLYLEHLGKHLCLGNWIADLGG